MRHLLRITFLFAVLYTCFSLNSYSRSPEQTDSKRRYSVQIDIGNAYISGLCIMHTDDNIVTSSIVNEFGVSTLTYRYDLSKGRLKIISIVKQMNRWHIKKMLKSDLKIIMEDIQDIPNEKSYEYQNTRFNIKYTFVPINN